MTRKNQLHRSGTRLQRQGAAWLQQSRQAGETFLVDSRTASVTFAEDIKTAGEKLVGSLDRSSRLLQKAVQKEALDWQALVLKTREAYWAALRDRLQRVETQAVSTREALTPEAVEATVLESAKDLLEKAHDKVDERLEKAAKPSKPAKRATPKASGKPKAVKARSAEVPLRNYDQLTAKDVVGRLQRLSPPQATAVLDYERSRKKRATVIRAAEHRLSAAS